MNQKNEDSELTGVVGVILKCILWDSKEKDFLGMTVRQPLLK